MRGNPRSVAQGTQRLVNLSVSVCSARIASHAWHRAEHMGHRSSKPIQCGNGTGRSESEGKYNGQREVGTTSGQEDEEGLKADEPEFILILLACATGIATGGAVVVFNDLVKAIRGYIWEETSLLTGRQLLTHFSEQDLLPRLLFAPLLGALMVGCISLVYAILTDSDQKDTNMYLDTIEEDEVGVPDDSKTQGNPGRLLGRATARMLSAIITLGTGSSLGPEGPSVEIGRDLSQGLGSLLRSKNRHIVSLLASGSGAGVAAGFNAPIAGVFFAVETVLQQGESQNRDRPGKGSRADSPGLSIAMVLLASVLAAIVSQAGLGSSPAFRVPDYRLESLLELPLYLIFGAVCGVVSSSFTYSLQATSDAFDRLREDKSLIQTALLPSIGGLTTGILALDFPEILYQGFDNVNSVLSSSGDYTAGILLEIVVLKIIATAICRGSGLKGGIYAPSIFIGAALGSAYGLSCQSLAEMMGLVVSPPQAYALVGVGALLASTCEVPLTSILLLFELTRDYLIIVPTLVAVGISYWVSSYWRSAGTQAQRDQNPVGMQEHSDAITTGSNALVVDDLDLSISQVLAILESEGKDAAVLIDKEKTTQALLSRRRQKSIHD